MSIFAKIFARRKTTPSSASEGSQISENSAKDMSSASTSTSRVEISALPALQKVPHVETRVVRIDPRSFNFAAAGAGSSEPLPGTPTIGTASAATYLEDVHELSLAARLLRAGKAVAVPSETVYGLAANALDATAIAQIYALKGRPSDNPLIVHVNGTAMLREHVAEFSDQQARFYERYENLIQRFWPGPLTILLPKKSTLPLAVTRSHLVAVRLPSHPVFRALINLAGVPLAAPSANLSGRPSPTCAAHVLQDLAGRVECIIDDGCVEGCAEGVESTVVDGTAEPPLVLRVGAISLEQIRSVNGWEKTTLASTASVIAQQERPATPGMKYRHYAPRGRVVVLADCAEATLQTAVAEAPRHEDEIIGMLQYRHSCEPEESEVETNSYILTSQTESKEIPQKFGVFAGAAALHVLTVHGEVENYARALFRALRWFDEMRCTQIYVQPCPETRIGCAAMERLRKAASTSAI